jgi:hypothetical protein
MLMALSNRDARFLKAVYPLPIKLIDHERHIPAGKKYIAFDGRWRVWKMTIERVPIPQGAFPDLAGAIYMARKK